MDRPTVSVIVPAHNAERYLAETLESVSRQRFSAYEIIVVDDGSTDGTASIAQSFARVRYLYQARRGPAFARNEGFGLSRGKYLAFLDADDVWNESMLERSVNVLETQPAVSAVHTNWLYMDAGGNVELRKSRWQPWRGDIFERLLVSIPLINPAILWRRKCFEEIGGFDQTPEVNDDWLNWLRIAYRGHLFECLEQPLVYYRKHGSNLTIKHRSQVIESRKKALDLLLSEIHVDQGLQNRAYAQVHWEKSMAALQRYEIDEAAHDFGIAVALNEQLLLQAETYYAIAYGGKSLAPQSGLDTKQATRYLGRFLAEVEKPTESGRRELLRRAWGEAYFNLAKMAYGAEAIGPGEARAYLSRATRRYPEQFVERARALWALRILAGRKAVGVLRKIGASGK